MTPQKLLLGFKQLTIPLNFRLRMPIHIPYMEATMFMEALICGASMAVDLTGSGYAHSQNSIMAANDGIASDWKQVGNLLQYSINNERPKIEAQVEKQLHLKLG